MPQGLVAARHDLQSKRLCILSSIYSQASHRYIMMAGCGAGGALPMFLDRCRGILQAHAERLRASESGGRLA